MERLFGPRGDSSLEDSSNHGMPAAGYDPRWSVKCSTHALLNQARLKLACVAALFGFADWLALPLRIRSSFVNWTMTSMVLTDDR